MIPPRRNAKGFTLVEVMIVVAIIGILAAIALPSYSAHVAKTRRGGAQGCVTELAQFLERNYTLSLRYDLDSAGAAVALPNLQCRTDLNGFFTFATNSTATTYTLTATPEAKQASADKACGCPMTLNQQGIKGVGASCGKTVADCWR